MRRPFFFVAFMIIAVFAYLWQQNMSMRMAYKVSSLQTDHDKLISENDILRLKINSILALEKMDKIAKEKNLSRPDEKYVIYIN
jgi:cell division protein FtsL